MNELLELLQRTCPGIDFECSDTMIDDGILDSLDIVTIVTVLMDEYDVEINVDDLIPENFNSVQSIYELIESKKG